MECQKCAFNPIVQALSAILQTYTVVIDKKNVPLNAIEYMVYRHKITNSKISKVAAELKPVFNKLRTFIELEMLPKCQKICRTCSKYSNDDNLSRSGQTIVSMDAMAGASGDLAGGGYSTAYAGSEEHNEGEGGEVDYDRMFFDSDDEDDANTLGESRGNWLNKNAIKSQKTKNFLGITNLPPDVEEEIKRVIVSFKELSVLQQCVLLQRWNEQSFVDIGSMTWVPEEFKRHNDKQLVSFWWRQIVKKFPLANALSYRKNQSGKQEKTDYKSHMPSTAYLPQELDFGSDL